MAFKVLSLPGGQNILQRLCVAITAMLAAATAGAALLGRAPVTPGGIDYQAYYDTDLDITWVADGNLAATMPLGFDHPSYGSCYYNGSLCWNEAVGWNEARYELSWIGSFNSGGYLGITTWRLPLTQQPDSNCTQQAPAYGESLGYLCTGSEMGHLFYEELGGQAAVPLSQQQNDNYFLFRNIQPQSYFTYCVAGVQLYLDTGCGPGGNYGTNVWTFLFLDGFQSQTNPMITNFLWPVVDGDLLAPVPTPAAVWLFCGALGLLGWARRKTISRVPFPTEGCV